MDYKKYVCPNCGREMSEIRYVDGANCKGVTVKCKKCGKIVEIFINSKKTIDKN